MVQAGTVNNRCRVFRVRICRVSCFTGQHYQWFTGSCTGRGSEKLVRRNQISEFFSWKCSDYPVGIVIGYRR